MKTRTVLVLSLSQVVSWGTLYYAFPAMAAGIATEGRWSNASVSAAFSLSLLVSALCGPMAGRLIEGRGGRVAMTAGSALAAASLALIASAPDIEAFFLGWVITGVAAALTLYEAAFSVLAQHRPGDFRRSVGVVTVAGGFASTVFWPVSALFSEWLGWRGMMFSFAALQALICLPLHWRGLPRQASGRPLSAHPEAAPTSPALPSRLFLLATGFGLSSLVTSIAAVHLIPRLVESGESTVWAAGLAALAGPFQVAARLSEFAPVIPSSHLSGVIAISLLALSMWALVAPGGGVAVVAAVAAYGMANGALTIVRSASLMQVAGPQGYVRSSGLVPSPSLVARAAGPILAAAMLSSGLTYEGLFLILTIAAVLSLGFFIRANRQSP